MQGNIRNFSIIAHIVAMDTWLLENPPFSTLADSLLSLPVGRQAPSAAAEPLSANVRDVLR